jgi:hypothetical protein
MRGQRGQQQQRQRQRISGAAVGELEVRCRGVQFYQDATATGGDVNAVGKDLERLREGEGDKREVAATQPGAEDGKSDHPGHPAAEYGRRRQAKPGIEAVAGLQHGIGIGADAEKRGVAETGEPTEPAGDVPRLPECRRNRRQHRQICDELRR